MEQVEETRKGFKNSVHIQVENTGHEQAMWDRETFDESIPAFLQGRQISSEGAAYSKIIFLPLEGESMGHPSVR